jgi:hypothetical protein
MVSISSLCAFKHSNKGFDMRLQLFPIIFGLALLSGCSASLPKQSGFISNYSTLEKVDSNWMRYISEDIRSYKEFMVDPIEIRVKSGLNAKQKAELANYMHEQFVKSISDKGFVVVSRPGPNVARVKYAITDVDKAKWYLNLHPATKATGAGLGGASMEGEVIDSVTGEQLAAVIRSDYGSRFEIDAFSKLDDMKDAIKKWADAAADRLDEIRKGEAFGS